LHPRAALNQRRAAVRVLTPGGQHMIPFASVALTLVVATSGTPEWTEGRLRIERYKFRDRMLRMEEQRLNRLIRDADKVRKARMEAERIQPHPDDFDDVEIHRKQIESLKTLELLCNDRVQRERDALRQRRSAGEGALVGGWVTTEVFHEMR
jgi:hypothetical protein